MQAKYWLSIVSCVAVTAIVGCGDDASDTLPGTAGSSSGGSGGKNAAGSNSGGTNAAGSNSGGTNAAGTANGGSNAAGTANGGTDAGGADAGGADTGGTGGTNVGGGGAGGTGGGGAGGGGTGGGGNGGGGTGGGGSDAGGGGSGGGGAGGMAGSGGGGNEENPSSLCDRDFWKYTFQVCPHSSFDAADNQATLATDGNGATFVTSGATQNGTMYAIFDLHGNVDVESLTLDYSGGDKGGDASALLKVQGSNDGNSFTDITAEVSGALTAGKVTIPLTGGDRYRFIKLLQLGTSASWWAIPEINITCGAGTQAAVPADSGDATVRTQWKITTPNSACPLFGGVANMVDTHVAGTPTDWASIGKPGVGYWITVDMGATADLTGVHLIHKGTDYPQTLKVQVSADGVHFTDAALNVPGNTDLPIPFPQVQKARFFRIVSQTDSAGGWWSIQDLDIDI